MNKYSEYIHQFNITSNGRPLKFSMRMGLPLGPELYLFGQLFDQRIADPEIVNVMTSIIRPGDRVIDGGANIGYFAVLMSQLVGPTGHVIAVEPGPNNIGKLEANLTHNICNNVIVRERPLYSEHAGVTLYMAGHGGWNSLRDAGHDAGQVNLEALTLPDLGPARFVKLDVEGAEAHIMSHPGVTPEIYPFIVAEINETALAQFGHSGSSLRLIAQERGYDTFMLPKEGSIPVLVPPLTRIACTRANTNVLFSTIANVGQIWSLIAV